MGDLTEAAMAEAAREMTEDLPEQYQKLQLGHRLMMLGHIKEKLGINRESLKAYREGMMPAEAKSEAEAEQKVGDGMLDNALVLGNVTLSSAQDAQPAAQQPVQQQQPAAQPADDSTLKKWLKGAAIAALPLAGIGGTLAYNALTAPDTPANYQDTYSDVEAVQLYKAP